jgi:glycosyltransferase involved in cell wall biosynthesis
MAEPLVSVIVPTFNRAYCLADAVDSVLAQSHGNVEVIIIDDGSTDDTTQLVATRWGRNRRVKYFAQANQGVTAARNHGLSRATGDFIALLDSDDRWKSWKLAAQIAAMSHCPEIGMVWTDMQALAPDGAIVHPAYLKIMYSNYRRFTREQLFSASYPMASLMSDAPAAIRDGTLYTGAIYPQMFMGSLVHTSTVLLRRSRLEAVKGFNESLKLSGEDYDFHLRTCREGPVGFIDLSSIEYRVGMPDRLTHDKYRVPGFTNVLATITQAYERDRDRIQLPPRLIRLRFAEVHAWLGEALLDAGNRAQAARMLGKSLRSQPRQLRTARLLALALLPASIGDRVRSVYRGFKKLYSPLRLVPQKRSA